MIWNNLIAPHSQFGDVIRWNFKEATHPQAYLFEFFKEGLLELNKRQDGVVARRFLIHVKETILQASVEADIVLFLEKMSEKSALKTMNDAFDLQEIKKMGHFEIEL